MRLRSLSCNGVGLPNDNVSQVLVAGLILTAALIGSFLRGYVKWPKKANARSTREVPEDKAYKQWNEKTAKIHVFPTSAPPSAAISAHDFIVPAQLDDPLEFDPEKDYAQVLAEARRHLKSSGGDAQIDAKLVQQPISWLPTPQHAAVYRQLESVFAEEAASVTKPTSGKSTKLWKSLLFWHRPKKQQQQEEEVETFSSIFGTPQRPSFGPPRTSKAGTKSKAARRGNSGPIYTDGLPSQPSNRARKPFSGPLGTMQLFSVSGKDVPESPYQPLQRPFNPSSVSLSPPLYSV